MQYNHKTQNILHFYSKSSSIKLPNKVEKQMCPVPSKHIPNWRIQFTILPSDIWGILLPKTPFYPELAPIELKRPTPHSGETPTHSPNVQPKLDCQHSLTRAMQQGYNATLTWTSRTQCLPAYNLKAKKGILLAYCHWSIPTASKFTSSNAVCLPRLHRMSEILQKCQFMQTVEFLT